jgi:hypothetical protein
MCNYSISVKNIKVFFCICLQIIEVVFYEIFKNTLLINNVYKLINSLRKLFINIMFWDSGKRCL